MVEVDVSMLVLDSELTALELEVEVVCASDEELDVEETASVEDTDVSVQLVDSEVLVETAAELVLELVVVRASEEELEVVE